MFQHHFNRSIATIRWGISATILILIFILMAPTPLVHAQEMSSQEPSQELTDFAIEHLNAIQSRSFRDNVEYCGLLGYNSNGELEATPAKKGRQDSCLPDDGPEGFWEMASYHTHGGQTQEADTEVPSLEDLTGDIDEKVYGYIATPGGRIWLDNFKTEKAQLLCDLDCVKSDPNFEECEALIPKKSYTIDSLKQRIKKDEEEQHEC